MQLMLSGIYTMRSKNSGKCPRQWFSNSMHIHSDRPNVMSSSHRAEGSIGFFCFTSSPQLIPMRKMGMRLQNISICPTASCIGGIYCTITAHTIATTGIHR